MAKTWQKLKGMLVMRKQSLPLFHSQVYHLALQLARRLKSLPGHQPHVLVLEKTNSTAYHLGPAAAKHSLHGSETSSH